MCAGWETRKWMQQEWKDKVMRKTANCFLQDEKDSRLCRREAERAEQGGGGAPSHRPQPYHVAHCAATGLRVCSGRTGHERRGKSSQGHFTHNSTDAGTEKQPDVREPVSSQARTAWVAYWRPLKHTVPQNQARTLPPFPSNQPDATTKP